MLTKGATAIYLFDERDGQIIHNRVDPETDLTIPARYYVLHPAFLRPWRSPFDQPGFFRMVWSYRNDIALNIVGFIPVGFVFMAYFSTLRRMRWPSLNVICIGFALSFTIEALQRFLPTRDSGMTDLVTNTAGTIVGVALYHVPWSSRLLNKIQESVNSFQKNGVSNTVIAIRQAMDDDKVPYSA
jgi:glycopeptide antibiotics resistance protein